MCEKICRTCTNYENGRCYSLDFANSMEDFMIDNFRVAESGILSETVLEFLESYLKKHRDEYSLEDYLMLNFKMSNKRVREISGKSEDKLTTFIKKFSRELMDEISNLYEQYEYGGLHEKPSIYTNQGYGVSDDFCCKYWR